MNKLLPAFLTLVVLTSHFPSEAAESDKPPSREVNWSFSLKTSYPVPQTAQTSGVAPVLGNAKERGYPVASPTAIQPPVLAKLIDEIEVLDSKQPAGPDCDKAMDRFAELLKKYPARYEIYRVIPTCRMGDSSLQTIQAFLQQGSSATLKKSVDAMRQSEKVIDGYYRAGDAFFAKALTGTVAPEVWEAHLDFVMTRSTYRFISQALVKISQATSKNKQPDEALLNTYLSDFQKYLLRFGGDEFLSIARMMAKLQPKDPRYQGILGSLLVGKAWTTVLSAFFQAAAALPEKQSIDFLSFLQEKRSSLPIGPTLEEAEQLLTPLCQSKFAEQACRDLELIQFIHHGTG